MKQYKVFKHPAGVTEAVKQGWTWPGFFFGWVWAMVKKMWGLGVGLVVGYFVGGAILGAVVGDAGIVLGYLFSIVASIVFGVNGNTWRERHLASRGFEHVDTVTAASPEGAVALYLKAAMAGR